MRERFPAWIRRRITGAHKLNAFKLHPGLIGGAVEAAVLHHLAKERDDPLRAVFVHVRQVDLITEEDQPLVQLYRGEHDAVGRAPVLAVVVEGFQHQFWRGSTGEVQANNLERKKI